MRNLYLLVVSFTIFLAVSLLLVNFENTEENREFRLHRWNAPKWRETWTLLNGDDIFRCNDKCKKSRASLCEDKGDFLWPLFTCCKDECPKTGGRCPKNRSLLVEC